MKTTGQCINIFVLNVATALDNNAVMMMMTTMMLLMIPVLLLLLLMMMMMMMMMMMGWWWCTDDVMMMTSWWWWWRQRRWWCYHDDLWDDVRQYIDRFGSSWIIVYVCLCLWFVYVWSGVTVAWDLNVLVFPNNKSM